MKALTIAAELLLVATTCVNAFHPGMKGSLGAPPLRADEDLEIAGVIQKRAETSGVFDQLIDHSDPSKGTFKQRYWYNDEFYAGEGSPVVLNAPGENASDGYTGYVTNRTIPGAFGQAIGGAVILIEHRYWGESSPYDKLTVENLQQLTLENAVKDLTYFAHNVKLPFDPKGTSSPKNAPWVLSGCSYSGALAAWVNAVDPGTFWSYHCSSAVVEAMEELWEYFDVTEQAMPRNCSADFQRVIRYVDRVLTNGTEERKQNLKERFGFGSLTHMDDFAAALMDPDFQWQSLEFDTGYNGGHRFCDYLENRWPGSTSPQPDENGVGVCKALKGLIKWYKEVDIPGSCASYGYPQWKDNNTVACYDSYDANSPIYTDQTVRNPINRQWQWMLCNEPFKYWRTVGPLTGRKRIVSKFVTKEYVERQCELWFPAEGEYKVGVAKGLTTEGVNKVTGGWYHTDTKRLMWTVGEVDPWLPATPASPWRPGGPLKSTPEHPVRIIPGGAHCGDMLLRNANANAGVKAIYDAEVQNIKDWVAEYYEENNKPRPGYKG